MFKLKHSKEYYKKCYTEYLIEKFPKNYFDFHIDIGACGILAPWHINHMGNNNDKTTCIGFEPEESFFNIIKTECESLSNVHLHKSFFGKDMSLKELLEKYNIEPREKWCFSCDCEGDEKYIFNNIDEINILKNAEHIAFEIHPKLSGIGYEKFIELFKENFGSTHKIIRTYHGNKPGSGVLDNSSFMLTKFQSYEDIIKPAIENFDYNWHKEKKCLLERNNPRQEHSITYIN